MIQFNLLPDVKVQFLKMRRLKRLVTFIAVIVTAASFAVFVLLFIYVKGQQAKSISDLNKDIKSNVSEIQKVEDLDKVLTIQNQLSSLPALNDKRIYSSRLLVYLNQLTPAQASISKITVDFEANTIAIEGDADALSTINKYADTFKFTDMKVNGESVLDPGKKDGRAFKDVVLGEIQAKLNDDGVPIYAYKMSLGFDPIIFAVVKKENTVVTQDPVQLVVPGIISTRSETEKPKNLIAPQQGTRKE